MEDNTIFYYILAIIAALLPVAIIFFTLRFIRKKRETGTERKGRERQDSLDPTDQLKSVKEERIEKKGIRKTKN